MISKNKIFKKVINFFILVNSQNIFGSEEVIKIIIPNKYPMPEIRNIWLSSPARKEHERLKEEFHKKIKNTIKHDYLESFKIKCKKNKQYIKETIIDNKNFPQSKFSILGIAIIYKAKKILKYIIKSKLFKEIKDKPHLLYNHNDKLTDNTTINNLTLACIIGDKKIIKLLLKDDPTDIEETLLWVKRNRNFTNASTDETIKLLYKHHLRKIYNIAANDTQLPETIYPNEIYPNENNILHLALQNENYELYKNILKKNLYLNTELNNDSKTPLDILANNFIELIESNYTYLFKNLMTLVKFSNIKDHNNDNLLHHAVKAKNKKLIKFILFFKPNLVLAQNRQNETPIHIAAKSTDHEILKYLIEKAYYGNKNDNQNN